jgi:hypothetical protein
VVAHEAQVYTRGWLGDEKGNTPSNQFFNVAVSGASTASS